MLVALVASWVCSSIIIQFAWDRLFASTQAKLTNPFGHGRMGPAVLLIPLSNQICLYLDPRAARSLVLDPSHAQLVYEVSWYRAAIYPDGAVSIQSWSLTGMRSTLILSWHRFISLELLLGDIDCL